MKRLAVAVIFVLIALTFAGCALTPYHPSTVETVAARTFDVYVCGAVANEGFYSVEAGTSWTELVSLAGLLAQSIMPEFYTDTITGDVDRLVINYYDGQKACNCVNANSVAIAMRLPIANIPDWVVERIADHIEAHGTIRNKQQLAQALGDAAEDFCYRFFVDMVDYEKAD